MLLFAPDEIRVVGEALSIIAGNGDNEAEYPLEEDLWELAKEKLATMITPSMRIINCRSTMVDIIKKHVDRSKRTVKNKNEILGELRKEVLKQVPLL